MAGRDPDQARHDRKVEVPGDTNSADIVDRTGEQMPQPRHDGIDDKDLSGPPDEGAKDDEAPGAHPV
ncbi:MAG: hypothetical protein Q8O42_05065 [Acidobacteriota bacterium]|nr:hypothetical protein [Acidobacteriota bacterium]